MAKTSMVERDKKRIKLNKKFNGKRDELRKIVASVNSSEDERFIAMNELQSLPRDSSKTRQRSRCSQCGRSRAYNRLTGLCRIHMRKYVMEGQVPGMHKASW